MIHRIDVSLTAAGGAAAFDSLGQAVRQQIAELGMCAGPIRTARIFLIDSPADRSAMLRVARELLADPILETADLLDSPPQDRGVSRIEVHLQPGVMDPVAASTQMAIRDMGIDVREVRTGRAYLIEGDVPREELARIAARVLANGVIESVHFEPFMPVEFPAGQEYVLRLRHVDIRALSDEQLMKLSREGHLFLSLAEMKAIQDYYREQGREPTDIELETLAQTWSEHCVHKTLKSAVDLEICDEGGEVIARRHYDNLIRDTIFRSTMELMEEATERRSYEATEGVGEGTQGSGFGVQGSVESSDEIRNPKPESMTNDEAGMTKTAATPAIENRKSKTENPFCLSVFSDNAGVIAFDETDAVCFKVETHNHPSAIEPYGGSATGIGGVIRDVLGTGLAARPIANTDVFCVADPSYGEGSAFGVQGSVQRRHEGGSDEATKRRSDEGGGRYEGTEARRHTGDDDNASVENRKSKIENLPKGVIHPRRILRQVVAGVRDYGNRMGIPTVNGAVYFDNRYLGNPLVFCGCVGIIPRDKIHKQARSGDAIVVIGGRTGRDGIHGATFSSAELTDTHADEFSHAVQIGNAITEKKVTDVVLQARDRGLFTAITDCGAGGLSSAVGEMGEKLGAVVDLDRVPLKYAGLRYDEIWISEAQERMVLSVPQEHVDELLKLAAGEDVEATVIGTFGTEGAELVLRYAGTEVGRLSMRFLHNGLPKRKARAVVVEKGSGFGVQGSVGKANDETRSPKPERMTNDEARMMKTAATPAIENRKSKIENLLSFLSHPNIASKHWIVRQYDHEVQGGSVIKPLGGPRQMGPMDAAVLRPKLSSYRGVALGCGLAPHIADPYAMAIASIDEAIRNVVAVGADLDHTAILDNFCWPSVDDEETMGELTRACEACYDAAKAYRVPFISGKDSLNNQFTNQETGQVIRIPNTLLISAIAVIEDVRRCVSADLKDGSERLILVRPRSAALRDLARAHRAVARLISAGLVRACHDISDGGVMVAAAEMCIASGLGAVLNLAELDGGLDPFAEANATYLLGVRREDADEVARRAGDDATLSAIGQASSTPRLLVLDGAGHREEVSVDELTRAWRGTLDW